MVEDDGAEESFWIVSFSYTHAHITHVTPLVQFPIQIHFFDTR